LSYTVIGIHTAVSYFRLDTVIQPANEFDWYLSNYNLQQLGELLELFVEASLLLLSISSRTSVVALDDVVVGTYQFSEYSQ